MVSIKLLEGFSLPAMLFPLSFLFSLIISIYPRDATHHSVHFMGWKIGCRPDGHRRTANFITDLFLSLSEVLLVCIGLFHHDSKLEPQILPKSPMLSFLQARWGWLR